MQQSTSDHRMTTPQPPGTDFALAALTAPIATVWIFAQSGATIWTERPFSSTHSLDIRVHQLCIVGVNRDAVGRRPFAVLLAERARQQLAHGWNRDLDPHAARHADQVFEVRPLVAV